MMKYVTAFSVLTAAMWISNSADAKGPKFTDPEKTDADFAFQGEYVGDLQYDEEKERYGVHVIAQGEGKFRVVGYHGGLAGAGWNGEDPVKVDGEFTRKEDTLEVMDKHGRGVIKDGAMTVFDKDGKKVGKLERVVRESSTLGQEPPKGAVILYGGADDAKNWRGGKASEDGLLMQGVTSLERFGDHKLHIEFRLPYQPQDRGQGRGNSGIYVQGRYEVQMLDSFGLDGKHNECGGIYSVKDPDVNMCYPPLQWQTYDIDYTAAKFDGDGKMIASPKVTVMHNGVVVHKDVELPGDRSTTAAPSKPGPDPGPVYLQNHGCPVRYRNIWVVKTGE